jgi:hypothetical protein
MDFLLYLGAINAHLLAQGRRKADQRRVHRYFLDGLSAADAEELESNAQGCEDANQDSGQAQQAAKKSPD